MGRRYPIPTTLFPKEDQKLSQVPKLHNFAHRVFTNGAGVERVWGLSESVPIRNFLIAILCFCEMIILANISCIGLNGAKQQCHTTDDELFWHPCNTTIQSPQEGCRYAEKGPPTNREQCSSSSVCSKEVLRLAPTNHHLPPAPPLHTAPCTVLWCPAMTAAEQLRRYGGGDSGHGRSWVLRLPLHLFFIWLLLWKSASPTLFVWIK